MSAVAARAELIRRLLAQGRQDEAELVCGLLGSTDRAALAFHLASQAQLPAWHQIAAAGDVVDEVRAKIAAALIRACVADDLDSVAAVLDVARASSTGSDDVQFLLALGRLAGSR